MLGCEETLPPLLDPRGVAVCERIAALGGDVSRACCTISPAAEAVIARYEVDLESAGRASAAAAFSVAVVDAAASTVPGSGTSGKDESEATGADNGQTPCPVPGCKKLMNRACKFRLCKKDCVKRFSAEVSSLRVSGTAPVTAEGKMCIPAELYCTPHKPMLPPDCCIDGKASAAGALSLLAETSRSQVMPRQTCCVFHAAADDGPITGSQLYRTAAKVLLLGIGSDEQLAGVISSVARLHSSTCTVRVFTACLELDVVGYGRHRTAFKHGHWQLLREELQLDITRLWKRNLGRDDRCCSDHGVYGNHGLCGNE